MERAKQSTFDADKLSRTIFLLTVLYAIAFCLAVYVIMFR